jgi:16S rRNA (uracil1498-N3)-methyltransferase
VAEPRAAARFAHPFGQPVTQVVLEQLDQDPLRIEGEEARHLASSLRLAAGDSFVATDGHGAVARLIAESVDRRGITARVLERARVAEPSPRVWLVADAEGARGDWIVEKAVELGAFGFLPCRPPRPGRVARWQRLARAALKQSLGAHELRIEADGPGPEFARARLAAVPEEGAGGAFGVWIAHPEGADPLAQAVPAQGDLFLVCGPPGGFTPGELAAWEALPGARRVGLGDRRLRAETAALALLTAALLRFQSAGRGPETA